MEDKEMVKAETKPQAAVKGKAKKKTSAKRKKRKKASEEKIYRAIGCRFTEEEYKYVEKMLIKLEPIYKTKNKILLELMKEFVSSPLNDEVLRKSGRGHSVEHVEKASKLKGSVTGIPTGFIDLDYKTSGMHPSDLVLIAARPSMGKTAFVLNIAQYMAFRKNVTVAIFSLEMSKEQLVNRLLAMESHVDSQNMRTGNLKDEDWTKLVEGADIIGRSNLIIDDTPGISIAEMRSKCRKYKLEHNLGIIMIDYLQLMSGSGKSDSR